MSQLRSRPLTGFLSVLLLAAIGFGYSICGLATLAHADAAEMHHRAPDRHDGDADHCCTVFAAQIGSALRQQSIHVVEESLAAVGLLPSVTETPRLVATSAPAPATSFCFPSRSSPPTSPRAPPFRISG